MFVHIEAPDESGHMGSREEKLKAIEAIDGQVLGPLLERLPALGEHKVLIVSDHATPVSLRTHTPDPVPFAMATGAQLAASCRRVKYGEREAEAAGVTITDGHDTITRLLRYSG